MGPWMIRVWFATASVVGVVGCGGDDGDDGETGASSTGDESGSSGCVDPPNVVVVNNTPWPIAALEYRACGSMDVDQSFPFPPPGLDPGATSTVTLPSPGCYELQVQEPSGCLLSPRINTGELGVCASFTADLIEDLFACPGG